jgi:hypothetical protein
VIYTKSAYRGKEHFMRRVQTILASAALLAACPILSASTINVVADASANEIGGKSAGTLPDSAVGIGGDGYILFDYNSNLTLTSGAVASGYASSYTVDATQRATGPYSDLAVGGGAEELTGVQYQSVSAGATFTLMTFTLSSGTPSSFVVSVLQDNANGGGNNDLGGTIAITTTDTLGPQSTASQTLAGNGAGGNSPSSDFYSFEVTNAAPGDKIAIVQTLPSTASTAEFGGVAFQSVPEPASALMAGWGAAVLLLGRRRRSTRRPPCRP